MAINASADDQSHKAHRSRQSGPNAKKKAQHNKKGEVSENDRRHNPKVGTLIVSCILINPCLRLHLNLTLVFLF